jgi:dTDP-4-amino-4,6-dideoxygalactose transaminase
MAAGGAVMRVPYVDLVAQHAALRAEILEAVGQVLDHGQFILGPEVLALEQALARTLEVPAERVVAVASGTDALVLALKLAGIGPGAEVLVPSHTFFASVTAIVEAGAVPVFVDVDLDTMLVDEHQLRAALGPRVRGAMIVHLGGFPCDVTSISKFCREHDLALIEDCAQSLGARVHGRATGTVGLGAFSLHPLKILGACGDAGFLCCETVEQAERTRRLRNLGLRDRDHCVEVARHSRLDTLQAAILLRKLARLDAWLAVRRGHAAAYDAGLGGWPRQHAVAGALPSYSTYVIRHPRRDALRQSLLEAGIDAKVHYPVPAHRQEAFARYATSALPNTERLVSEILSIPISQDLSDAQRDYVSATLRALA